MKPRNQIPSLTAAQSDTLKLMLKVGAPITVADLPNDISLLTLRMLSERGLLAITVQMTPEGERAIKETMWRAKLVRDRQQRKRLETERQAAKTLPRPVLEPSSITPLTKAELMAGRARVKHLPVAVSA